MRENKGFFSFAFDSAHVKYGVWTWPLPTHQDGAENRDKSYDPKVFSHNNERLQYRNVRQAIRELKVCEQTLESW